MKHFAQGDLKNKKKSVAKQELNSDFPGSHRLTVYCFLGGKKILSLHDTRFAGHIQSEDANIYTAHLFSSFIEEKNPTRLTY